MTTVLVVEDDDGIALPLTRTLEREGYRVERLSVGLPAVDRLRAGDVSLMILDLGLPDVDGLEVCQRVREDGFEGGIIILTARGGELDRVVGLDYGADDYLPKPFALSELLARARALLRRSTRQGFGVAAPAQASAPAVPATAGPAPAAPASAGPAPARRDWLPGTDSGLRVDRPSRRAWAGIFELVLTPKEFDLLALLEAHKGVVLTRERIMDEVWDANWFGSTKTLDVTVGRLRQKLEEHGAGVRIVAVRGVGFRLQDESADA